MIVFAHRLQITRFSPCLQIFINDFYSCPFCKMASGVAHLSGDAVHLRLSDGPETLHCLQPILLPLRMVHESDFQIQGLLFTCAAPPQLDMLASGQFQHPFYDFTIKLRVRRVVSSRPSQNYSINRGIGGLHLIGTDINGCKDKNNHFRSHETKQ